MAAPRTWADGDIVTANGTKGLNTELRDQLNTHRGVPSTITTTGTQTALALPAGRDDLVIFANNATLLTLQGITAGLDGQRLTIMSIGAGQVDLVHENGSATAANRIICTVPYTISLAAGTGSATLIYDSTTARWRVHVHEQGAWILYAYASGNFTASGSMTWTVADGDEVIYYWLRGTTLFMNIDIQTSTVGGTPDTALRLTLPGGYSAKRAAFNRGIFVADNAVQTTSSVWSVSAGVGLTKINFNLIPSTTNWAASTDATRLSLMLNVEIG